MNVLSLDASVVSICAVAERRTHQRIEAKLGAAALH